MRRLASFAAVLGGLVASNAFAAFTFSTQRTALTGTSAGLDRVVLYALGSGTYGDVFAADITISTPTPNGLKFTIVTDPDSGDQTVSYLIANPVTATRTRASNILFNTLAPGFPQPTPTGATYSPGVSSFSIVGFDGRDAATTDVGLKAGPTINGGQGAALLAAVVPTGSIVSFTGQVADDQATSVTSTFNLPGDGDPGPIEPGLLVVVSPAPQTVNFGKVVSNGAPFSATISATDSNSTDILTLAIATLPAGVSGIMVSPAAGGVSPQTFTVTGTLAYSTNKTTVTIPFNVSNGVSSTPGSIVLNVVPEPAALLALAGAAAGGRVRRRCGARRADACLL